MGDAIRNLPTPDVCIIGSGPAGLSAAHALAAARRSIVVLESGSTDLSSRAQELNDGDHHGLLYNGLVATRHRQVGGAANIWDVPVGGGERGAKFVPLSADDMAEWPVRFDDLREHYLAAQALCGLGPFEYDADPWATPVRRPFRLGGTGLASGVYQFGTARRFRALADEVRDTRRVILAESSTAIGLVVEGGSLRAIRAVASGGERVEVRPRAAILACGAVENARLLLLADLERRAGLSWLGRGFMEHARDFSLLLVPESPEVFAAASFYDRHLGADGSVIGGRLSPSDDARRSFALPNAAMTLIPRARDARGRRGMLRGAVDALRSLARAPEPDRYGWSRVRSPADAFDAFRVVLNLEQRPDRSNRVELSKRRDRFGNPLPHLFLAWSEREQAQLDRLRELLAEWFRTAGLGRLEYAQGQTPDLNAHHHAGTTRMGTSARDGVVDADGRVFGLDNLFVAGASVFPAAGYANPTLTVVALALRVARAVDRDLG